VFAHFVGEFAPKTSDFGRYRVSLC
jgi:hypothetical protein